MLICLLLPVFQKADGVDAADASNITIQMHDLQTGVAIKGGSLVVYQVAKKDSAGKFQYTSQFSSVTKSISSLSQDQIMTADFANTLASYVTANQGKLSLILVKPAPMWKGMPFTWSPRTRQPLAMRR